MTSVRDEGLYSTSGRVEPDKRYGDNHIDLEGNPKRLADEHLQDGADNEKSDGSAENLGDEEHPGSRTVASLAETLTEIAVDADEAPLIENGHEHKSNDYIAHDESKHHLEIGIAFGRDHSGHGYESNARDGGSDHGDGHKKPWHAPTAGEEGRIVGVAGCKTPNSEKHGEIGNDCKYNCQRCHFSGYKRYGSRRARKAFMSSCHRARISAALFPSRIIGATRRSPIRRLKKEVKNFGCSAGGMLR